MQTTYIYTLTDPETNEVRYVGKTNNINQRYRAHLNKTRKHQIHKANWIKKLKQKKLKPIINIVDEVSIKEWIFWEQYWISQFKTWGFNLVNYTLGGDGCSFANQTSFKKGQNAIPILQLDLKGNVLKEFDSIMEAKQNGFDIQKRIDKKVSFKANNIWLKRETYEKLLKEELDYLIKKEKRKTNSGSFKEGCVSWNLEKKGTYSLSGKKKSLKVIQLDNNENVINIFNSYKEASQNLDCHEETIRRACNSNNGRAINYIWKFKK